MSFGTVKIGTASVKYSELAAKRLFLEFCDRRTDRNRNQDSDLKSNDSDVDTGNVLVVTLNGNSSELGASLTKVNNTIKYNPSELINIE